MMQLPCLSIQFAHRDLRKSIDTIDIRHSAIRVSTV